MNKIITCEERGIYYYSETIVPRESFRHVFPDIVKLETELADKEKQLAEARAEIESKSRLIEQMRDALKAADDLIDEYAADYEHRDNVDDIREEIKAALAAERGNK